MSTPRPKRVGVKMSTPWPERVGFKMSTPRPERAGFLTVIAYDSDVDVNILTLVKLCF